MSQISRQNQESNILGIFCRDVSSREIIQRTVSSFNRLKVKYFRDDYIDQKEIYNEILGEGAPTILIVDIDSISNEAFQFLEKQQKYKSALEVIVISKDINNALLAIELGAIQFILKPIHQSITKLRNAIQKGIQKIDQSVIVNTLNKKMEEIQDNSLDPESLKISLPISNGVTLSLLCKDILKFEAFGALTNVYLNKNYQRKTKYTINIGIGDCLDFLPDSSFYRLHKKYIINRSFIKEILPSSKYNLKVLSNSGTEIPIARRKKREFIEWYENHSSPSQPKAMGGLG